MKRSFDWRTRLHTELANWRTREFLWGESDCSFFFNACVLAMTDTNVLECLALQPYQDEKGVMVALANKGFDSISAVLTSLFDEEPPMMAQEGDIAVLEGAETGEGLGIVLGERVAVLGMKGFGTVARKRITRAFRVP